MLRQVRCLLGLVALALVLVTGASGETSWSLSGNWNGSAGNTITWTQSGTAVTWVSKGAGNAWVHDGKGQIAGNTISGSFQDRKGYSVYNHGSLKFRIDDSCHMVVTEVVINEGAPSAGGERFTKAPCTTAAPTQRLTLGDLRRNKEYRVFFGLDDTRVASSFDWAKLNAGRCSDLVDRATGFVGVTRSGDIPGETSSGQHSASIFGNSDFHDLLDSSVPASDLEGNVFVNATKPYEPALRAAIASSEGSLQPADVLYLALRATHGSYPLAVLTTLNLLKDVTFEGRDAGGYASRLVRATPHSAAAIAKERELYEKEIATLKKQNEVVGKLVSLRQNPLLAQDKMGPWYHAFTILTVGALYPVPIPKGQATAFWEHFRKAIGAFGTSEAPFNFEKATLDTCFALATDSPGLSKLSR